MAFSDVSWGHTPWVVCRYYGLIWRSGEHLIKSQVLYSSHFGHSLGVNLSGLQPSFCRIRCSTFWTYSASPVTFRIARMVSYFNITQSKLMWPNNLLFCYLNRSKQSGLLFSRVREPSIVHSAAYSVHKYRERTQTPQLHIGKGRKTGYTHHCISCITPHDLRILDSRQHWLAFVSFTWGINKGETT